MGRTLGVKDISPQVRVAVAVYLATLSKEGRLRYGTIARKENYLSSLSGVYATTLPPSCCPASHTRPARRGSGLSNTTVLATDAARSAASGIPRSALHRHLKNKVPRRFISRVKPALTDDHTLHRLTWALAQVQRVQIDEKWFNMCKASSRYYLSADEELPYRSCSNRRYIGKVMFIAAVARPRYDFRRKTYFDGKIGIWPIVERIKAQKASKNRPAGTPITKNINMSRQVYVSMLKEKVFPAIREKWPEKLPLSVFSKTMLALTLMKTTEKLLPLGSKKIKMMCQPPRSPDCNILDLGIFNAIQSIQYRQPTNQIDGLTAAVQKAFNSVKHETIEQCFLTLQKVLERIIENEGGDGFKLPRVNKTLGSSKLLSTSFLRLLQLLKVATKF
ncbi:LOW QUALITY PROTEIN: hypothetical protein PHMEG_00018054 [Phytophthora megakarya]|uniref:Uncharacterized protein n=1 Tax=Phytophthora megakarya TaxID=4795 RepID=A0A225VUR9_9STRA|nr:LOW QUALITY PROTEIN: hypothetical protein PHMEG_00018054 [Phytophthora megakarya]